MKKKITLYSLVFLSMTAFQACILDRNEPCPGEESAPGYLQLAVSTSGNLPTRANPTGGEEGDGSEHGRENENSIYNLSVFLYVDEGQGLDGDYTFKWKKYADNQIILDELPAHPNDRIYSVRIPLTQKEVDELGAITGTMRLAVIANAGDITWVFPDTRSLVRDVTYKAWQGDGVSEADYFLMAPAYNGAKANNTDGLVTKSTESEDMSKGILYNGTVNLERVAARIDLKVTTDNIVEGENGKSIRYTVGGTQNYLTLTNAIPVNLMQFNSYLVKQVAPLDYSAATWLTAGNETTSGTSPNLTPTNYVMSPKFQDKPVQNTATLTAWYGNSRTSWLRNEANREQLSGLSPLSSQVVNTAYKFENANDNERSIILTYANENTHPETVQLSSDATGAVYHPSDYLTGLLFRAQYHPADLFTDGACTEKTEYKDGDDFWLFRTVKTVINEGTNIYFASEAALNDYVATLPAGGRYETLKFDKGVCYYNIWIKHANIEADPEANFPMKYGVVRNNIYRVSLNFHGIGQPTPDIREPYAVTSRVFVIKWNFRPQPEIIM